MDIATVLFIEAGKRKENKMNDEAVLPDKLELELVFNLRVRPT